MTLCEKRTENELCDVSLTRESKLWRLIYVQRLQEMPFRLVELPLTPHKGQVRGSQYVSCFQVKIFVLHQHVVHVHLLTAPEIWHPVGHSCLYSLSYFCLLVFIFWFVAHECKMSYSYCCRMKYKITYQLCFIYCMHLKPYCS